jgi:hypothetical protein
MKKALFLVLALVAVSLVAYFSGNRTQPAPVVPSEEREIASSHTNDALFKQAFESRSSGELVEGVGEVLKVLRDDVEGSRHQRFIVRLKSGQTILIAHNIDLAPRVPSLKTGAVIEFSGVYEWNKSGGTVHWTHHDPDGEHEAGWIRYDGRIYQ